MTQIKVMVALIDGIEDIKIFNHEVNDQNYILIRKALNLQRTKIINILKEMKKEEIIKSIYIPKNRKIQKQLDKLVETKNLIDNSITKIKELFYK